ncbi:transposase [Amedibacterium intestinale]|uniref:transposase n=1 Tax=Amedibacterium intestinale TaxID=2583452 RepID=UPI003992A9CA
MRQSWNDFLWYSSLDHKKFLPNSILIVDHYHVAQELHRRLDSIRLRIMKPLRCINTGKRIYEQEENYYILKHHNIFLFKHFERARTNEGKRLFDANLKRSYNKKLKKYMNPYDYAMKLISIHPDLEKAWKLKDEIAGFYCSCTLKNAPEEIERIIQDFLHSEIDELVKFGYTMINWKNEIVHSFIVSRAEYSISKKTGKAAVESKRINNAKIEKANSTIKTMIKSGNGYTNWERFRNRVMLILEKGIEFEIDEKDGRVKMVAKKRA